MFAFDVLVTNNPESRNFSCHGCAFGFSQVLYFLVVLSFYANSASRQHQGTCLCIRKRTGTSVLQLWFNLRCLSNLQQSYLNFSYIWIGKEDDQYIYPDKRIYIYIC